MGELVENHGALWTALARFVGHFGGVVVGRNSRGVELVGQGFVLLFDVFLLRGDLFDYVSTALQVVLKLLLLSNLILVLQPDLLVLLSQFLHLLQQLRVGVLLGPLR